jgi:hypothetical protein
MPFPGIADVVHVSEKVLIWSAGWTLKAGRAANLAAREGVVTIEIPRPLAKEAFEYTHSLEDSPVMKGVQVGA